jgi:hypothetical protein
MATRGRLKWTKRSTRVKTGIVRARLFHLTMQSVVFRLLFAARLVESGSATRTPRTNSGTRACSYLVSTNLMPDLSAGGFWARELGSASLLTTVDSRPIHSQGCTFAETLGPGTPRTYFVFQERQTCQTMLPHRTSSLMRFAASDVVSYGNRRSSSRERHALLLVQQRSSSPG